MTTARTAGPADVRRATRDTQEPIIGGVASGLARHLGLPRCGCGPASCSRPCSAGSGWRSTSASGWCCRPTRGSTSTLPASRARAAAGGAPAGSVVSATSVRRSRSRLSAFGGILLLEAVLGQGTVFWPILIGVIGVGLLWRQADEAQRERWLDTTGRIDPVRVVLGSGGWASYARLAAGLALIVVALVLFAFRGGSIALARDVAVAAVLGVVGIGIVVGPWIYRLASDLTAERAERVRTQERADVAAHLHDSVLQTLALIQKNAGDGPHGGAAGPRPGARPAGLAVRR